MFKYLYTGVLAVLLVLSPVAPYLDISVFAADKTKIPPGTYNITDIKLIDVGSHPTTVEETYQLYDKTGSFSQRTGYSFYILACDYSGSYDEKTGKKKTDANGNEVNPWKKELDGNSGHQDRKDVFKVDGMENRVLAAFTAAYGAELAPLLMEYMKEKNIEMSITRTDHRVSGSFDGINYKDSNPANNSAHCSNNNDRAFFYQDDDVYLGASFTIPKGSCEDEEYAEENPEECGTCEDDEYAEAHKEECETPPDCDNPEYAAAHEEKCNPPPPVPTCEEPTPATVKSCGGPDEKLLAKIIPEAYTELKHNTVHQEK